MPTAKGFIKCKDLLQKKKIGYPKNPKKNCPLGTL
jgi:hypothetical protein